MKILVTGAAGLIGSHLCDRLLRRGDRVIGIDNFISGSVRNIRPLRRYPNFTLLRQDINEPFVLKGALNQIYNLACPASPVHYQKNPVETVKTNTSGMVNMLELARKKKAILLQASTSEVYGDPLEHPQKESYRGNVNTLGPRACYDEGKRVAETLCMDYHREYKVDVRLARIFNTYGPRMAKDDGRVVSNFIIQALRGEPLTIYGDGSQTRSFCYVDDLVEGLIKLMASGMVATPVNLGNPGEFTMNELAKKVLVLTGSTSRLVTKRLPKDDPKQRQPDITLAKKKLQWQPSIALEEGLKKTIEYFRTIL